VAVGQLDGRTIWAIDPLTEGLSLPPGWMVNGFAPAGTVAPQGSGSGVTQLDEPALWYESAEDRYHTDHDNWVFPETGFFRSTAASGRDDTPSNAGEFRQSFMIRFDGKTGGVAFDEQSEGLVFAPDNRIGRGLDPWRLRQNPHADPQYRFDGSMRADEYIRRILNRPWTPSTEGELDLLLGKNSSDTVLVRPTTMLALYNVRDLAQEIVRAGPPTGFRGVDRGTGSLYTLTGGTGAATTPDNYTYPWSDQANEAIPTVARLFTVDRYNGGVVEVTP
jgi:hypothetical protein